MRFVLCVDAPRRGAAATPAAQRRTTPFDDCVLFTLGGTNYTEYQNVVAQAQRAGRRVVCGATELVAPAAFLRQIAALGGGAQPAAQPVARK